jgi:hypothetical protein
MMMRLLSISVIEKKYEVYEEASKVYWRHRLVKYIGDTGQ